MKFRISAFVAPLVAFGMLLPVSAMAAPAAQDETPLVTITSARALPDVVGDRDVWMPALSPDGAFLAYINQNGGSRNRDAQLCVYTFSNAGKVCTLLDAGFSGLPYALQWSPDSTTIAFSENPVELGNESDIWAYDVTGAAFLNVTDDGLTGLWRWLDTEDDINLDYLPMWDQTDGSLVFWRVTPLGGLTYDLGLYRLADAASEPELIRSLGEAVPNSVPTIRTESLSMDGPSALAADGSAVAAILSTPQSLGPTLSSVWLIPLDASADAVELISADDFEAAVPAWRSFAPVATGLSWTGDSAGVVAFSSAGDARTPFAVVTYADVASGEIAPLVDFSGVESSQDYFNLAPGSTLPIRAYSPWTAGLTPTEDGVLMVNDLSGVTGVFASMVPPDGTLPTVIASRQSVSNFLSSRSSRSSDGKVLIYGTLLQTEVP